MPKKSGAKKGKAKPREPKVDSEVTEIVCIVDRSGSMGMIKDDAIGGFNQFLKEQKEQPGEATMTIVLFDNQYEFYCSGKPVKDVEPFNEHTYVPRGCTALNDAIGKAINELDSRNPKKAIIMILTDGHENSSIEFTKQQIKQLIATAEGKGYAVIYLSADANCFDEGKSYGIGVNNITSFTQDTKGAHVSHMSASFACSDYRTQGRSGMRPMSMYSARASNQFDSQHKPRFRS
ncbi:MAG: VWA domain-containing protein [Methanoregula sp.]|jgi:hypothetical protein|nr:VWA domain-containing protein [Methanoregula sp.]